MEITASSCLFIPTTISLLMPIATLFFLGENHSFSFSFSVRNCTDNICIIDARQRQSFPTSSSTFTFLAGARARAHILYVYLFPFLFPSLFISFFLSLCVSLSFSITHANSSVEYDYERYRYTYIYIHIYVSSPFSGRFFFLGFFFFLPSCEIHICTIHTDERKESAFASEIVCMTFSFVLFLSLSFSLSLPIFILYYTVARRRKKDSLLQQLLILIIYDRYRLQSSGIPRHNHTSTISISTNNRPTNKDHFSSM